MGRERGVFILKGRGASQQSSFQALEEFPHLWRIPLSKHVNDFLMLGARNRVFLPVAMGETALLRLKGL